MFKQIIEIRMDSVPAPYFTNLLLYYYKSRSFCHLTKSDMRYARRFANVFWFITDLIDDRTTVNDGKEFEKGCKEIYPPKLELKIVSIFYFD